MSGLENEPLCSPANVEIDYDRDLGYPGAFPYTRGVYPSMYRGKLWTMRQFAGFGTAEETNARFRYLLDHGQTGLSTAFDMPTLMGYDSDHPRSLGEVGREGVAIDSLEDMEQLFAGIPLGEVSTSMTINAPAAMLLAFYICVAEEQGVSQDRLARNDPDGHPQGVHRPEGVDRFPPEPSMRLCVDMIEYCARNVPLWHTISISGYHIREAGSTAAQELAFTLADGFAYVQAASSAASTWTTSPRGSPSSSTRTSTSSRRWRSTGRAAHLGAGAARALRGQEPALVAHALPRADRRRLAHCAAAGGEHRADGARGARRRSRRLPVAAHELLRRGARAADGARGQARPSHAAGDRPRDGGGEARSIRSGAPTTSRT